MNEGEAGISRLEDSPQSLVENGDDGGHGLLSRGCPLKARRRASIRDVSGWTRRSLMKERMREGRALALRCSAYQQDDDGFRRENWPGPASLTFSAIRLPVRRMDSWHRCTKAMGGAGTSRNS